MEIKQVTIPACSEHEGFYSINIMLYWACPVCGKLRGEIFKGLSYDGSRRLSVSCWKNPCGHVDAYPAVRKEAKENGLNGGVKNVEKPRVDCIKLYRKWDEACDPYTAFIYAEATVSYEVVPGSRRLETFQSGGLGGIDPMLYEEDEIQYQNLVDEQIDDLKFHLAQFGVDLSNWKDVVYDAEEMYG